MKNYTSYAEQVNSNVTDMVLFNNLSQVNEFWHEPLYELLMNKLDPEDVIDIMELPEDIDQSSEEYYEAESEYIYETIGSAYQLYMVELDGSYNEEHERLCIFYDEEVGGYILPVFHYGTAWRYVGAMG